MDSDAIVERAKTEALRLVNRSRAGWPEEAVEHAARRAAELAREECRNTICEHCAAGDEYNDGRHHFGLGNSVPCKAAAIRAGSGE